VNDSDWIICERSNRWAAALRLVLDGQNRVDGRRCQLREVRTLADLAASLSEGQMCLACIEVRPASLGDVLAWLAKAEQEFGETRFVALLDYSLQPDPWAAAESRLNKLDDVSDALVEAGAALVVTSPRRLGPLVELGRRSANPSQSRQTSDDAEITLTSRVWASLPWQAG
jgi:hypothetical protein